MGTRNDLNVIQPKLPSQAFHRTRVAPASSQEASFVLFPPYKEPPPPRMEAAKNVSCGRRDAQGMPL